MANLSNDATDIKAAICGEYRPYDSLPAFRQGFDAYQSGRFFRNSYGGAGSLGESMNAIAWDHGFEAAARYARALDAAQRGAVVERIRLGKAVR